MIKESPARLYQEDPTHRMPRKFLSDGTYAEAIEGMIIVNTDVVIINRAHRSIFLANRTVYPMKGLWIIGGRRLPGETAVESMHRCFKRETKLDIDPERFTYVRNNEYTWSTRKQAPENVGCHNKADTFLVELTRDEVRLASTGLDPNEYEPGFGLKEYDRGGLVRAGAHEALIDLYDSIFSRNEAVPVEQEISRRAPGH